MQNKEISSHNYKQKTRKEKTNKKLRNDLFGIFISPAPFSLPTATVGQPVRAVLTIQFAWLWNVRDQIISWNVMEHFIENH